jgi:hypothetical protein
VKLDLPDAFVAKEGPVATLQILQEHHASGDAHKRMPPRKARMRHHDLVFGGPSDVMVTINEGATPYGLGAEDGFQVERFLGHVVDRLAGGPTKLIRDAPPYSAPNIPKGRATCSNDSRTAGLW